MVFFKRGFCILVSGGVGKGGVGEGLGRGWGGIGEGLGRVLGRGWARVVESLDFYTVDTEIKVKLIPRKYFFAFAFALILFGQMIFRITDYIDTSPRILLSLSLS